MHVIRYSRRASFRLFGNIQTLSNRDPVNSGLFFCIELGMVAYLEKMGSCPRKEKNESGGAIRHFSSSTNSFGLPGTNTRSFIASVHRITLLHILYSRMGRKT